MLLKDATKVYSGSVPATKVYLGDVLVWAASVPQKVPGLLAWYDANVLPIGTLTSWPDLSGRGHGGSVKSGCTAPTVVALPTGTKAARWSGTNGMVLNNLGLEMTARSTWSVIAVYSCSNWGTYPIILSAPENGVWSWIFEPGPNGEFYIGAGNGHYSMFDTPHENRTQLFCFTARVSAPDAWFAANATAQPFMAYGPSGACTAIPSMTGPHCCLGVYWNNAMNLNGDIAEILVYDHTLTDSEKSTLESYLRTKWSLW